MKGHEGNGRDWIAAALARHEGPLVRYAARLTGDLEQARDVVQDCFLRLLRERREDVEGHEKVWLFKVCRHRAFDFLRKGRRMDTAELADLDGRASKGPAPLEKAEHDEAAGKLTALLAALPERQREVVRLRFQEGLSYRQISEVTGASVSHVGVLLHTAIRALRARLDGEGAPARRQA
jgi:RNA polymerase sigma-70 factor (ECF subfamily)